jgi:putative addiction module component (TIGR02574 family)
MKIETLPLTEYSLTQKLLLMERLWAELAGSEETLPSPDWHRSILQEREKAFRSGKIKASSWEQAKTRIRKRLP